MPKLPSKPKKGQRVGGVGVIYARYSSHNQKDMSIEQQVALDRQLADEHGIDIIEVYADRAVSGTTDKRPQFQRMMKDAEKGHISYVIAWKSSRIGRNMLEAMMNEVRLNELGIRILYVEEDFDDTAAGRFAARSMMNVNQFYSENMAEDIRRGLQSNADKCLSNGPMPFGYRVDKDRKYELDPVQAPIVKEIFERVANREALVDIARSLNKRGILTRNGNPWRRTSFEKLLKNDRYRGVYIYGDTRIPDGMPRIVSDELFYLVQEVSKMKLMNKRHRLPEDYLLTGKLYCGECGEYMTGTSGTSRNGSNYYYYACAGQKAGMCSKRAVRREEIEERITQAIKDHILTPDVMSWIADRVIELQKSPEYNAEIKNLEDRLAETGKTIKNIMTAIEQGIITPTTKTRLNELEEEQGQIKANLSLLRAERVEVDRDHVIAWLESFRLGDINNRKYQEKIINSFLVAAYLYDDGRIKILFDLSGGQQREIIIDREIVKTKDGLECSRSGHYAPPKNHPPFGGSDR